MIELIREYRAEGTFGQLTLEDGAVFATVERPWINNTPKISCIPEGVYRLALRDSNVVHRTSRGQYLRGWEITNIPNRTLCMFHVANLPREVEGCIGVGKKHGFLYGEFAVLQSLAGFDRLMQHLAIRSEWYLEIKSRSGMPKS